MLEYPIYLKLSTTKTWYIIKNDHSFTEFKTLGKYYSISDFSDDIMPMRNHISDLISNDKAEIKTEDDYSKALEMIKTTHTEKAF